MLELAARLAALDPGAADAVRVIQYFDGLTDARVGLEALIRSASRLAGCPVGIVEPGRRAPFRILPDGRRETATPPPDPAPVPGFATVGIWLDREGAAHANDPMLLERLAGAVRIVLERTSAPLRAIDPTAVERLVDPATSDEARGDAAVRLGLPVCAALHVVVSPASEKARRTLTARIGELNVTVEPANGDPGGLPRRAGIGATVELAGVPDSYRQARIALRLTASGAPDDPGPTRLRVEDLGGLTSLAAGCDLPEALAEVAVLERAVHAHPWVLPVLDALITEESVRAAATVLRLHHSTLQERMLTLSRTLGYPIQTPAGRTRAHVALLLRRLQRNRY